MIARKQAKAQEYVPFGDEWRAFVMKMRKADIVELLRKALIRKHTSTSHNP